MRKGSHHGSPASHASVQDTGLSARVLLKPDGVSRVLSASEATAVATTWNSLLGSLAASPTESAVDTGLVAELPSIIAGRQSYRSGYNLESWRAQAHACRRLADGRGSMSVHDLHTEMFRCLYLECSARASKRLSVDEVETIYGPSQWFAEDPVALTSYMRSGPVVTEMWRGANIELALLVKFAIRHALGITGRYNLVHCDLVVADRVSPLVTEC